MQINDLPEFDVERAMGIEHVNPTIDPLIMGFTSDSITPLFPWQLKEIT
ncbi:hypothetical protein VX159_16070 [Dechloromonas sp. ZY10]